jgi:hypothetical protein
VTALVSAIVHFAHRRRLIVLGLVLMLTAGSIEGIRRLSFDSNILSLLPADGRTIQAFRTFVGRFGSLEQLYVVFTAPEGHTIGEFSPEVDGWVAALRAAPEIERVDPGGIDRTRDFGWLAARQLLLLPDASLDEALSRFTPDGLRAAVTRSRDLLSVPSADVAAIVRQDPIGLFDLLRSALGGAQTGVSLGLSPDGYVSADRRARLVIARPRRPPYDSAFSHALDARLRRRATTRSRRRSTARRRRRCRLSSRAVIASLSKPSRS